MAVGIFRGADDELIKSSDALVDYNPLMPGQASPFEAGTTDNPLIKSCELSFKTLWGSQLAYTSHTSGKGTRQTAADKRRSGLLSLGTARDRLMG
jgi:hypothetical protein